MGQIMPDINRQIFDRQAAQAADADQQRNTQTMKDLEEIRSLRLRALQLLKEKNYPFGPNTGLRPASIIRDSKEIAAWHLSIPDDEGYTATWMHITAEGELVQYRELYEGSFHLGSRRLVGHECIPFEDVMRAKTAISASSEAANVLTRLRHFVTTLESLPS